MSPLIKKRLQKMVYMLSCKTNKIPKVEIQMKVESCRSNVVCLKGLEYIVIHLKKIHCN